MRRSTLLNIAAVLLGFLVAGVIVELSVKNITPQMTGEVVYGYDPELGAIPLPNQRGCKTPPKGPSYQFSNNSCGFRGSQEYGAKNRGKVRVLFLGDSYTYGVGVNDDQTFPYLVEKILRARHYPVECINAGNPGVGTDYELKLLEIQGPKLKPDLVALCFFWNDFYDNGDQEYFTLGKNDELIPQKPHSLNAKRARIENLPVVSWLLSWSNAANLVRASIVELLTKLGQTEAKTKYKPEVPECNRHLSGILFEQIIKTAKGQGSDIIFFYLPDEPQITAYRKSKQISLFEKVFLDLARSEQQEHYSLTPAMTAVKGKVALPLWGHWSPAANQVAARYISGIIEQWLANKKGAQIFEEAKSTGQPISIPLK